MLRNTLSFWCSSVNRSNRLIIRVVPGSALNRLKFTSSFDRQKKFAGCGLRVFFASAHHGRREKTFRTSSELLPGPKSNWSAARTW